MCPEGFVLGPDWKNCDDVDECAAGDNNNHDNHNHDNHENHDHNDTMTDYDECATGDCHLSMYLYDLL